MEAVNSQAYCKHCYIFNLQLHRLETQLQEGKKKNVSSLFFRFTRLRRVTVARDTVEFVEVRDTYVAIENI